MRTRRLVYWWFRIVISGRFLEKFLVRRAGPNLALGAGAGRHPNSGLADELLEMRGAAGHGVSSLPRQIGQAAGQAIRDCAVVAMPRIWPTLSGKRATSCSTRTPIEFISSFEPRFPSRTAELVDADLQGVFGVVDLRQHFLGDQNPVAPERDAQRRAAVFQTVQHHVDRDRIWSGGEIGGVLAGRGLGGEADQIATAS